MDGEIAGIGYLNRFLGAQGLRAEGGTGTMNLSLGIEQGDIAAGSWGRVIMEGVGLKRRSFCSRHHRRVDRGGGFRAQGANRLSLGLGLDHYEVHFLVPGTESKPAVDPILLRGSGLRFELRSEQLDPSELPESSMQVEMGDVLMPDLRVLNLFLPASGAALLSAGQARLTGTLEKPAHGKSKAVVKLQGTKTHVDLVGHPMLGDFHLTVNAATVIPGTGWSPPKSVDLSGSGFVLDGVTFDKAAGIPEGWWFKLALPNASLALGNGLVAVGKVDLKARDLEPLFALFGDELGIPGILRSYLSFDGLNGGANLLVQPGVVEVTEADLRSKRLRLRGRILADSQGTHGELLLDDPPLSFGIALHRHGTGLQLFGAGGWYEDRLKTPLADDR